MIRNFQKLIKKLPTFPPTKHPKICRKVLIYRELNH
jgi:hypothetical protein